NTAVFLPPEICSHVLSWQKIIQLAIQVSVNTELKMHTFNTIEYRVSTDSGATSLVSGQTLAHQHRHGITVYTLQLQIKHQMLIRKIIIGGVKPVAAAVNKAAVLPVCLQIKSVLSHFCWHGQLANKPLYL